MKYSTILRKSSAYQNILIGRLNNKSSDHGSDGNNINNNNNSRSNDNDRDEDEDDVETPLEKDKQTIRINYQDISFVRPTTVEEMHAFIGLPYVLGLYKVSRLNLREFWTSDGTSPD
ncbi:hypothetical protein KQX54_011558 [Cotesia glomerata]|uniref:PiggyBac transposable element-derived protein domain-containing protein n=1 Tax=Cotesia glomerata TaxID=32391 RepID=A0AAV7HW52_COTGL|nr:hypothetical protein KQX54_011558 [Cotesia glomerata]